MNLDSSFYENGNELPLGYNIVKGYMAYFTVVYRNYQIYLRCEIFNNDEVLIDYIHDPCHPSDIEIVHDRRLKMLNQYYFTEQELLSSCASKYEYDCKIRFLADIYIKNLDSCYRHKYNTYNIYDYIGKYIYDPVSNVFVDRSKQDFVEKHIKLYKSVINNTKPSLFSLSDGLGTFEDIFMSYYECIPFADEDDFRLQHVIDYMNKNARKIALKVYETQRDSWLPMRLVKDGYVKKPTQKKLLEMANAYGDSQFAAVLLETSKDSKHSKSKFDL